MMERAMAAAAAVVVPVALRVLPLPTTLALCDAWPCTPGAHATPAALARRVDRWLAKGRALWRPTCLTRTIVLYTMLRQHGHAPRFHIGTSGPADRFHAHAWISLGDTALAEFDRSVTRYRDLVTHGP
jgi:hypothetical protein